MPDAVQTIQNSLFERFGERFEVDPNLSGLDELARLSARRVCRRYADRDVSPALLRLICASALCAPSKSDLQQADILILREKAKRDAIADLLAEMRWLREAPVFLLFLANGRRVPFVSNARGKPFPNDHFDLFFNATVDAALVMSTFMRAAGAVGLGCCPISMIRNHAAVISELVGLPKKVVPIAGMTVGWPAEEGVLSPRLPLSVTVHHERFDDSGLAERIDAYDRRRAALRPYRHQRDPARFGEAAFYGWSEDKARQYASPQRADFGAFVRGQGFCLD